jgi:hypothetical protein
MFMEIFQATLDFGNQIKPSYSWECFENQRIRLVSQVSEFIIISLVFLKIQLNR